MPGVNRPYTLVDVLGALNDQIGAISPNGATTPGLGLVEEVDETVLCTDPATATIEPPATWDNGTWGTTVWS